MRTISTTELTVLERARPRPRVVGAVLCAAGLVLLWLPSLLVAALGAELLAAAFWVWARATDSKGATQPFVATNWNPQGYGGNGTGAGTAFWLRSREGKFLLLTNRHVVDPSLVREIPDPENWTLEAMAVTIHRDICVFEPDPLAAEPSPQNRSRSRMFVHSRKY